MNYWWTLLQLLSVCLLVAAEEVHLNPPGCGKRDALRYIVNGKPAKEYQFPWMVHLHMRIAGDPSEYICGGTIITKLHVLTAAHCFDVEGHEIVSIDVLYGHIDWRRAEKVKGVKKLGHPNYNTWTNHNDIGVIKVERPFTFDQNVRPICVLLDPVNIINIDTLVAGWGRHYEDDKTPRHYLHYTSLRILPHEYCERVYPIEYHEGVNYCAYQKGSDTCKGDSGGPLFAKSTNGTYVQVGIISHGIGCAQEGKPGVYARVDAYASWLTEAVASDEGYKDLIVDPVVASLLTPEDNVSPLFYPLVWT
ncbi:hypothetical protein MTO96_032692 [Rhipicephalus appendiculatus]